MTVLPAIFEKAIPVIEQLEKAGYEAYFVGGSVRDMLLKKEISDVDIATSAFPAEVKALFPRTVDIGIEHGTVLVLWGDEDYEITTFRTESTYQDFRRPDEVTFVRSLEEDLKRRDFTINALAMTREGAIIDLFSGVVDLEKGMIRAVGSPQERFHEDALRMMRAVRFMSQLDFDLEPATAAAITEHHALLAKIAVERIQVEFTKLLLGKGRNRGLSQFISSQLYAYCPNLAEVKEKLLKFSTLKGDFLTKNIAWTAFMYDLALQDKEVEPFLRDWKCSKQEIREGKLTLRLLNMRLEQSWSNRMLYDAGQTLALQIEALALQMNPALEPCLHLTENYQQLAIKEKSELMITGADLLAAMNQPAGKWLGDLIAELEQLVIDNVIENQSEVLQKWALENRHPSHQ